VQVRNEGLAHCHSSHVRTIPSRYQIPDVVLVRPANAALLKKIKSDQKRWDKEHSEEAKRKRKAKKTNEIAPTARVTFYSPQYPEDEKLLVAFREYVETQELHEPRWVCDRVTLPVAVSHTAPALHPVSNLDRTKVESFLMVYF
jgi:hypothetical protein